jgi:hypothetical protein
MTNLVRIRTKQLRKKEKIGLKQIHEVVRSALPIQLFKLYQRQTTITEHCIDLSNIVYRPMVSSFVQLNVN